MEIGNITTFNDTSVTPGITYYYKVSAVNSYGEGPLSNEAFATPFTVPSAPMNLAADADLELIEVRSEKDWRGLILKRDLPQQ